MPPVVSMILAAALVLSALAFALSAWRIGRIADRGDFAWLGAFGAIIVAGLSWLVLGALA